MDFSGHHILTCAALVSFLPAGAKVGHRSLLRYYKQRFGTQRTVALSHNRNAVGRVLRQYRALGWGGDGGKTTSALGTASDLCPTKEHKKLEYADQTVKYSKLNHSLCCLRLEPCWFLWRPAGTFFFKCTNSLCRGIVGICSHWFFFFWRVNTKKMYLQTFFARLVPSTSCRWVNKIFILFFHTFF